jgi:cytochrome c peroxidase
MGTRRRALHAFALLGGMGCGGAEAPPAAWTERERAQLLAMRWPTDAAAAAPPASPGNAVADAPAAVTLGARLFFDTGLSANGQVSCATCHDPAKAFTDGRAKARGIADTRRNAPTLLGAAWQTWLFWDGRADSAWAQATGPLTAAGEHGLDAAGVRARVEVAHKETFEAVFGPLDPDPERVLAQVGKALEAYERTLAPGRSRFDAYLDALAEGRPPTALSPAEEAGLRVYMRKGDCVSCHNGPLLSDGEFHNLGLDSVVPSGGLDGGRVHGIKALLESPFNCRGPHSDARPPDGEGADPCAELRYVDPGFEDALGSFRTPTLRNVARTAPYMHSGRFATLGDVVEFYDELPGIPILGHRELTLQKREFTDAEEAELEAFLRSLDGAG